MAHKLARLVYRMMKFGTACVEQGMAAYESRYRQQQMKMALFPEVGEKRDQQRRSIECRHRLGGLLKYYQRAA